MCVCLSLTSNAFAYTSYDEGNMSTTYIQYFRDIVDGLPYNHNYVCSRTGQYEYILHSSDTLRMDDNGTFISDTGTTYKFNVASGYNSTYTYSSYVESDFILDTNDQFVYSNIGTYPRLDERGSIYEFSLLVVAIIGGICVLIRPIFRFIMRVR